MFLSAVPPITELAPPSHLEAPAIQELGNVDFRHPNFIASSNVFVTPGKGTEFNPDCGHSWKLDRYNAAANEFSDLEIDFTLEKDQKRSYALALLECGRRDEPAIISITVNGKFIAQGFRPYNGDGGAGYWDVNGDQTNDLNAHLRWDNFDISPYLQDGLNTIRISLDTGTQSGIAISQMRLESK